MADTQPVGLKSIWMSTVEYDAEEKSLENTLDDGKTYTNENAPPQGAFVFLSNSIDHLLDSTLGRPLIITTFWDAFLVVGRPSSVRARRISPSGLSSSAVIWCCLGSTRSLIQIWGSVEVRP